MAIFNISYINESKVNDIRNRIGKYDNGTLLGYANSGRKFKGIVIEFGDSNDIKYTLSKDEKDRLDKDLDVLKSNYKTIYSNNLISWLTNNTSDQESKKIKSSIVLYNVTYSTHESNSEFDLQYEYKDGNDSTPVEMVVRIGNGKITKVNCYDI